MQVRFADGGFMALQPNTKFAIENYAFNGQEDGSERAIFKLFRGGVRAISGMIGHVNEDNYQVSTPFATIGIRGTAYEAVACLEACTAPDGSALEKGLHARTTEGTIFVENDAGLLDVGVGQAVFVMDQVSLPVYQNFQTILAGGSNKRISNKEKPQKTKAGKAVTPTKGGATMDRDGNKKEVTRFAGKVGSKLDRSQVTGSDRNDQLVSGFTKQTQTRIDMPTGVANDVNGSTIKQSGLAGNWSNWSNNSMSDLNLARNPSPNVATSPGISPSVGSKLNSPTSTITNDNALGQSPNLGTEPVTRFDTAFNPSSSIANPGSDIGVSPVIDTTRAGSFDPINTTRDFNILGETSGLSNLNNLGGIIRNNP